MELLAVNKPNEVLIPLIDNQDFTIIPKIGEYVYKGNTLAYSKGDEKFYITSPVSGKIIDIKNHLLFNNNFIESKCIIVENDFKEMVAIRRYLHKHPELSFHEKKTVQFIKNFYKIF